MSQKWRMMGLLSLAELLGMVLWFSATAVLPRLTTEWQLDGGDQAWLTMSVQLGFVLGTFSSALLNLPDIFNARKLFAISAWLGAAFNAGIGLFASGLELALVLRFLTGVCLAGVYPPGMKIMASWFREGRGAAIGVLIAALTLGSASPHLLRVFGGPDWRTLMWVASASSAVAGAICLLWVKDGPHQAAAARFDWKAIGRALGDRPVRLANFGYLGHMWELYAMWAWIPVFLAASFTQSGVESPEDMASLAGFAVIGVGAVGCVVAGVVADRRGRALVTIVSMIVSGVCCLFVGLLFGTSPYLLVGVCLVWGFAVVADSAQFSASITELCEPSYLGTALTLQTSLGFLLTLATIRMVPPLVDQLSWHWVFTVLAIGPLFGIISMARLKRLLRAAQTRGV